MTATRIKRKSLNDENRHVYRDQIRRAYGLWTSQLEVIGQILLARMSRVQNERRGIGMYSTQSTFERPRVVDDQHALWGGMMGSRCVSIFHSKGKRRGFLRVKRSEAFSLAGELWHTIGQ